MQESTSDTFDPNRRLMHSGWYEAPPPPDGGMWDQLQEKAKAKQILQLIVKSDTLKQLVGKIDSVSSQEVKLPMLQKTHRLQ